MINSIGIDRHELDKFIRLCHNIKKTNPHEVVKFCTKYVVNIAIKYHCIDEVIYIIDNTSSEYITSCCKKLNLVLELHEVKIISRKIKEKLILNRTKNRLKIIRK